MRVAVLYLDLAQHILMKRNSCKCSVADTETCCSASRGHSPPNCGRRGGGGGVKMMMMMMNGLPRVTDCSKHNAEPKSE